MENILSKWPYFAAPLFLVWGALVFLKISRLTASAAAQTGESGTDSAGALTAELSPEQKKKLLRAYTLNPRLFFQHPESVTDESIRKKGEEILDKIRSQPSPKQGDSSTGSATDLSNIFNGRFVFWSVIFLAGSVVGLLKLMGVW